MKKIKNRFRIGIVISRFNEEITSKLYACCTEELYKNGISKNQLTTIWVPGAFEIPFVAKKMASTKKFDVVITLGCVIKGQTSHDFHISSWATQGVGMASLQTNVPILFGVLTPHSESQALKRVQKGPLNRGKEIAQSALEMIEISKRNF